MLYGRRLIFIVCLWTAEARVVGVLWAPSFIVGPGPTHLPFSSTSDRRMRMVPDQLIDGRISPRQFPRVERQPVGDGVICRLIQQAAFFGVEVAELDVATEDAQGREGLSLAMPCHQIPVAAAQITAGTGPDLIERDGLSPQPAARDQMVPMISR